MKRFRDWPWSGKLAAVMVALALLPIAIVTAYNEMSARREFVRDSHSRNLQQAANTAALVSRYLEDVVGDIRILAISPAAIEVLNNGPADMWPRLDTLMRGIRETKHLELLQVLDPQGTVIAATERARVGTSYVTAPFFQSALAGQSRVHDPRYLTEDKAIHMNASVPIHDPLGRIIGVTAARLSLDDIDRLIGADTNYGGLAEYGTLWDEQGIVLSSPGHPERRFHPIAPLTPFAITQLIAEQRFGPDTGKLLAQPGAGDALVARARWRMYDPAASPHLTADLSDGPLQVTLVPVPGTRWTYALATPEERAFVLVREQSARNLAVALLTAMFAMLISLVASRWVSRPLSRVGDAAHALASGDMTRRANLDRRDEIGQLAATFDRMADSLAAKDAQLRGYADDLERRVDERTTELTGLLSAIPDLIVKVSSDGRLVDYVPAKGQELGLPASQFLGRPLTDVRPHELSPGTVDRIHRALRGEDVEPHEYKVTIGGQERHYEARISPSSQGSIVVLVRDITDRRRAEERTRFLARAAATLSSSLDYDSTVETLAALAVPFMADVCVIDLIEHGQIRCATVTAIAPEREALARAARSKFPIAPGSDHPVAVALRGGMTLYADCTPETFTRHTASAEHASLVDAIGPRSLIVLPLAARGQMIGAMSLISVTPSRRYTQADVALGVELCDRAGVALDNARLYREVHESNRLKDEFLSTVSHELRTPLNAVLGWAQLLRRTGLKEPAQAERALDAIERNAQAQAQLVEDLLDTSRVVSGKLHVTFTAVKVDQIVKLAVESFRPLAKSRGIDLSTAVEGTLVPIMADAARLQQVIGNLVSNALKFTPAGGRVTVSTRHAGSSIEIEVADTGAGIAPEFLPYVFDRFRQGDSTTTRVHGGLGLGLSIARHLVEMHGGTIRAESAGEHKGSTFTVVIPVQEARLAPEGEAVDAGAPALTGTHVLVVDDQDDARALLEAMLGAAGATVRTAASAQEARRAIASERPHVLVSDIGMAGEDGYALIRSIRDADERAHAARLPSIAVTAYAREDDRLRAISAGFDRHVTKPVDPGLLLHTIADLTNQ